MDRSFFVYVKKMAADVPISALFMFFVPIYNPLTLQNPYGKKNQRRH